MPDTEIDSALLRASDNTGIPFEVLQSIAIQESNLNPKAKSPKGAMGLMQLMPVVAEKYKVKDPYNPHENALVGAKIISLYLRTHRGNWPRALASYNWGPGNVKAHPKQKDWPENTKVYINSIMQRAKQYFALWI